MFSTAAKRGKHSKMKVSPKTGESHKLSSMYSAAELGDGRPSGDRRFTNNYGKTAKRRGEVDVEKGNASRSAGRMFSWLKGDSY